MAWSKETPFKDGKYWFRCSELPSPKMVKIVNGIVMTGTWIFEITGLRYGEWAFVA